MTQIYVSRREAAWFFVKMLLLTVGTVGAVVAVAAAFFH